MGGDALALRRDVWLTVGLRRLNEDVIKVWDQIRPTRDALASLRLRVLRRGIWFRKLREKERKFMELTIRVVKEVRRCLLSKLVFRIVKKLSDAIEGEVALLMRTKGLSLIRKLSRIAQAWGNESASKWLEDAGFIQFLVTMNLPTFRVQANTSFLWTPTSQHAASDFWKPHEKRHEYDLILCKKIRRSDPFHRIFISSVFHACPAGV